MPPRPPPLSAEQVSQRLQLWFSPSLPTGAFSHGHGIESAIDDADVRDAGSLQQWLQAVLVRGGLRNDAILIASAWRCCEAADTDEPVHVGNDHESATLSGLHPIDALAQALCAGAERLTETMSQGRAFADATAAWHDTAPPPHWRNLCLPVVIGAVSARHALPLQPTLVAALQASVCNLAWIAARLLPLGQQATLRILATIEPQVRTVAARACDETLADLGSAVPLADIASMRHERLRSRVCHT